jgi:hypothetical protein
MKGAAALAAAVVMLHLAFVAFVVAGGFLAIRWPRIAWAHLPAAAWAAFIEFSGGTCPLTPLEQALRQAAGLAPYAGDFVAAYIFPVLYPEGLTRRAQIVSGVVVIAVNAIAYVVALRRRRALLNQKSRLGDGDG